jgi:hypothetical protein
MLAAKCFHLSFSKMLRVETRRVVKTQQAWACMSGMTDEQKSFLSAVNAFVFRVFHAV